MPRRPGALSSAQRNPLPLPAVHLSAEYPAAMVRAQARAGAWVQVRPGAHIEAQAFDALDRHDRDRASALAAIVAAHRKLRVPHVISHMSAALVHGLPLLTPPCATHLTQESRRGGDSAADLVRHLGVLSAEHVTTHRGLRVTTLERTVVDCALVLPIRAGLVVADAALHQGADRDAIDAIVAGLVGRRGVASARTVMRYADDGAESASESLTRYILLRAGLPRPTTQLRIPTRSGIYWADLGWEEERAALEYDGEGKYAGAAGAAELRREKARHDAITETGFRVGRVVAADLHSPQNLIARVARLLRVDHLHPRRDLA